MGWISPGRGGRRCPPRRGRARARAPRPVPASPRVDGRESFRRRECAVPAVRAPRGEEEPPQCLGDLRRGADGSMDKAGTVEQREHGTDKRPAPRDQGLMAIARDEVGFVGREEQVVAADVNDAGQRRVERGGWQAGCRGARVVVERHRGARRVGRQRSHQCRHFCGGRRRGASRRAEHRQGSNGRAWVRPSERSRGKSPPRPRSRSR